MAKGVRRHLIGIERHLVFAYVCQLEHYGLENVIYVIFQVWVIFGHPETHLKKESSFYLYSQKLSGGSNPIAVRPVGH